MDFTTCTRVLSGRLEVLASSVSDTFLRMPSLLALPAIWLSKSSVLAALAVCSAGGYTGINKGSGTGAGGTAIVCATGGGATGSTGTCGAGGIMAVGCAGKG